MERIYALIDKLCQQKNENASPAHLLFTVQLLQNELSRMQQKNGSLGTRKVAVTLPVNVTFAEEVVRSAMANIYEEPLIEQPSIEQEPVKNEMPEAQAYSLPKPVVENFQEEVQPIVKEEPKTSFSNQPVLNPAFDAVEENPAYVPYMPKKETPDYKQYQPKTTPDYPQYQPKKESTDLSAYQPQVIPDYSQYESEREPAYSYQPKKEVPDFTQYQAKKETPAFAQPATAVKEVASKKEVHEAIAVQKESLNDRLKEEKVEVAHTLVSTPIKDLRKGIGINDRFSFVNELFRGDNAAYERSLKTINEFNVYSEAEYWINRELKYKLGWNDRNETVQHFLQLVRRRFS